MEITPKTRKDIKNPQLLRIYINVHNGGKYPYARPLVKGIKISKSNWNNKGTKDKKNWVSSKEKGFKEINQKIYDLCIQWEAELKGYTTKELSIKKENEITGGRKNFLKYAQEFMDLRRNQNTKGIDKCAMNKLKVYLEQKDMVGLQFKDINQKFINLYYNWLISEVSKGTANQYLNTLRTIYRTGEKDETLNFKSNIDPFKGLKKEKPLTRNKSLSPEEWDKFKNYKVPANKPKYLDSHTMFLYQFWGALRVGDVMYTKWSHFCVQDNQVILDFFTQKNKTRIVREVPPRLISALLPSMVRYRPEIVKQLEEVNKIIKDLRKEIDTMKNGEKPIPDKVEGVLALVKQGFSAEEIEEIIKEHTYNKKVSTNTGFSFNETFSIIGDSVGKLRKERNRRGKILLNTFKELIAEHPDDYVFNLPLEKNLKHPDTWTCKQDRDRYQTASASHWYRLRQIAKHAGIKTNISSHVSRHTATQFLLRGGASSHEASEYLTHGSLTTTEIYRSKLGDSSNKLSNSISSYL